ncbi:hypothetical protein H4R34_005052 [Dimargaris verticillata]|uniref:Spc7 kinetochore protein domain-containing protein n=1 Tax=Dimargaris verticillata TaxID=2761393 RepID=A0A9W8EB42_9FUNG|nr:hypothetical protein H4R34_005052 [Dimargaris verticillata]
MGQTMDVTTCVGGIQFQGHNLSQGSPGATVNSPEALSMDLTTCVPQSTVPTTQEINSSQWTALVFEHPVEPAHTLEPIASPDADDTMATMDGMDMTECLGGIQVVAPCISLERTTIPSPELLSEALPQDSTSESVTDADVTMGVGTATLSPQPTGQTSTDNEPPIPITPVAAAGQPLPPCTPQSRRRPPRATLRKIGQSVGPVRNTDHCRRRSVGLGGSFATPPRRAERLSVQDLRRRQAKASPATLSAHTTPSDRPTTALGLLAASPGTPIINPRFSPLRLTPRAKTVGAAEHLLATPAAQLLEPILTSVPPETKPEQALPNILATQGGQPELSKSSAIPGSPAIADTADTNVTLDISQVEIDPTAGVPPPFALEYPASPLTALSPIDKLTEQSPSTKKPSAITSPVRSPELVDSPLAAIPPASKNLASTTTPLSARSVQPTSAPSPTIPDSVSEELQPTTTLAKSVQAYSPVTNTLLTSEAVAAIFPDPPSEVAKAYSHEDEPSLPGPISLADFLEMTGIRFLDDLEATAKRLPVPIHDSVAPGDDSTSVRDWLQQRIQTATTTLPKLELFQFLCTELEQYIRDGQRTIQKLERELQVNNPTSVLEYLLAPGAERLDLEQYFLRLKTHARLQAKKTWYTWREILVKPVIASYTESATALREDDQALQQMASSLAALTFTGQSECRKSHQMSQYLLEYKQNLVQQLQTVRERKDTIAKCDQEQLQSLHREIAEQSTVLSRYRHELADLQQQHVDQQVVLNRLVEEKTTLQRTIADAQNLSKSHQFYKATDLQSIKAEVESLCTVHGVRFTDVLPHECQLTYRRALAITIPRGQHFATAPIQLQVVSPGPSALTMAAEDLAVWRQVVADIAQQVNEPMVKANLTPRASLTKLLGQWHMVEQLQADIHLVRAQFPTELVYLSESHLLQIKVLFFNFASRTRFYLVFWMRSPLQAYPLPQLEWEFENVYGSTRG